MSNYVIARFYDFLLYPFLNDIRNKTAKLILQLNPESVIDICCGTGNQLKYLINSDIKLTGIDNSLSMLKAAKEINCFEQDARDIQFPDNSFDLALIQLALHEKKLSDQKKIIDEIYRILKSNGHLIIVDYQINKETTFLSKTIINSIEFLAGKEHYNNFKDYLKNNCTNKLNELNKFTSTKKILISGNAISIHILIKK